MNIEYLSHDGYHTIAKTYLLGKVLSIISIHNINRGPVLGGVRFYPYATEEAALTDVLRLSEAMSYKSALAGLNFGGGKAIINGDPQQLKSPQLLLEYAEFVNELKGNYITAKDVGITVQDLDLMATKTQYVQGRSGKNSSGDPSPMTAYGVFCGIKAAVDFLWSEVELSRKTFLIQGLGHVGWSVAQQLLAEGAKVIACDVDSILVEKAKKELGLQTIPVDQWNKVPADVFVPCAMGGIVTDSTLTDLAHNGVKVIAGGANNQLLDPQQQEEQLLKKNILYAPDYVINAGGVINIACESDSGYNEVQAQELTAKIAQTLQQIFKLSAQQQIPTPQIAQQLAIKALVN